MTDELFELLKRKGLSDVDSLDHLIMNRYTVGEIVELDRELAEIIDKSPEVPAPKPQDIAGFDFWPNGELAASATSFASCQHASCRANRVGRLARFATMWADSVYLPQYFGIFAEDYDDASWRIVMLGNLRALLTAEPAIRAGILRVSPEGYHLCPSCGPKVSPDFDETSRLLAEAKRSLHDAYIGQVEAQFQATGRTTLSSLSAPKISCLMDRVELEFTHRTSR